MVTIFQLFSCELDTLCAYVSVKKQCFSTYARIIRKDCSSETNSRSKKSVHSMPVGSMVS